MTTVAADQTSARAIGGPILNERALRRGREVSSPYSAAPQQFRTSRSEDPRVLVREQIATATRSITAAVAAGRLALSQGITEGASFMPTLVRGMAVVGAVALAIVMPSATGLASPWPVLLAAAVAFARPVRPGLAGAFLTGAAAWWMAMALRAGVLPEAAWSEALAAAAAITVCVAVALVSAERLPLFAGLGGIAAFAALYEPAFAAAPTEFLAASPLAFGSVVVATGLGFLAATAVDVVVGSSSQRDQVAPLHTEAV